MVRAMTTSYPWVRLHELATIRQGHPFRGAIPVVMDGPVQVIQLKNLATPERIAPGQLLRTHMLRRKAPDYLREGDVLLAGRGNRPNAVLFATMPTETLCSPHIYVIRVTDHARLVPAFLAWHLNQPLAQEALRRRSAGSRQLSLCKSAVARLAIPVPPLALQQRIVSLNDAANAEHCQLDALMRTRQKEITALTERLLHGTTP